MDIWIQVLVCVFAGLGAGLGTGFAGMSAAAVISPMLITFLNVPAYEAVGIALASDVLASMISAITYGKNKNIDIKNGLVMMIAVLCFTVLGSFLSQFVPNTAMGGVSVAMTLIMGIRFIVKPVTKAKGTAADSSKTKKYLKSLIAGSIVGLICGFIGAGGGMMMLFVLVSVLGYELKTAVGTSVFIMSFTAFTGSMSHFLMDGWPNWTLLIMCVVFTLIFALIAAKLANKASPKTLNRVTGIILTVLGIALLIVNFAV